MRTFIKLFSNKQGEISRFLQNFYNNSNYVLDNNKIFSSLEWEKSFENPIEMSDMIGVFIDNIEDYQINMWISLDNDILINVTQNNVDDIIRYMYERFPY